MKLLCRKGLLARLAGVVLATMTLVFLALPYVLSRHPGEAPQELRSAQSRFVDRTPEEVAAYARAVVLSPIGPGTRCS